MNEMEKIQVSLSKVGIEIKDIYELVNSKKTYPDAIPVLVSTLTSGIEEDNLKEGVIRALAVKEAKGKIGSILIDEFHMTSKDKPLLRWAIGNTMEVVIGKEDLEKVIEIVLDKSNGMSRQMFVVSLGNIKSEKSENVLINLLDDDEVAAHALNGLRRIRSVKALEKVKQLLNHPKPLIRKEAEKTLKKIEVKIR